MCLRKFCSRHKCVDYLLAVRWIIERDFVCFRLYNKWLVLWTEIAPKKVVEKAIMYDNSYEYIFIVRLELMYSPENEMMVFTCTGCTGSPSVEMTVMPWPSIVT